MQSKDVYNIEKIKDMWFEDACIMIASEIYERRENKLGLQALSEEISSHFHQLKLLPTNPLKYQELNSRQTTVDAIIAGIQNIISGNLTLETIQKHHEPYSDKSAPVGKYINYNHPYKKFKTYADIKNSIQEDVRNSIEAMSFAGEGWLFENALERLRDEVERCGHDNDTLEMLSLKIQTESHNIMNLPPLTNNMEERVQSVSEILNRILDTISKNNNPPRNIPAMDVTFEGINNQLYSIHTTDYGNLNPLYANICKLEDSGTLSGAQICHLHEYKPKITQRLISGPKLPVAAAVLGKSSNFQSNQPNTGVSKVLTSDELFQAALLIFRENDSISSRNASSMYSSRLENNGKQSGQANPGQAGRTSPVATSVYRS